MDVEVEVDVKPNVQLRGRKIAGEDNRVWIESYYISASVSVLDESLRALYSALEEYNPPYGSFTITTFIPKIRIGIVHSGYGGLYLRQRVNGVTRDSILVGNYDVDKMQRCIGFKVWVIEKAKASIRENTGILVTWLDENQFIFDTMPMPYDGKALGTIDVHEFGLLREKDATVICWP